MKYVLVGRDWQQNKDRYMLRCVQAYSSPSDAEFTDNLLEARIYEDAAYATVVAQSENMAHHGLRIKQISDVEWFEAKLKG